MLQSLPASQRGPREDIDLRGVCCVELFRFAGEGPQVWVNSLSLWASLVFCADEADCWESGWEVLLRCSSLPNVSMECSDSSLGKISPPASGYQVTPRLPK